MSPKFKLGTFVRVCGKTWIAEVLEIADVASRYHYRIFPVMPKELESSYWWMESNLEPASILEAIAEAANGDDDVSAG
jgi:hypothetical protein